MKLTREEAIQHIEKIDSDENLKFTEDQINNRALWLMFMNRFGKPMSFWEDMPIILDLIKSEQVRYSEQQNIILHNLLDYLNLSSDDKDIAKVIEVKEKLASLK